MEIRRGGERQKGGGWKVGEREREVVRQWVSKKRGERERGVGGGGVGQRNKLAVT